MLSVTDMSWKIVPYIGQALTGSSGSSVVMSMANVTTAEGNSGSHTATFIVSLSKAAGSTVSYDIATANGTATAGSDYMAASAHQTIAAGSTSRTFPVTIMGDTTYEDSETFIVRLSNVSGAGVANASATGVISNDDSYYPGVKP